MLNLILNRYSWTSDFVLQDRLHWTKEPQISDLIPLETKQKSFSAPSGQWKKRLVIGHNVGFDRSFIKEQYLIQVRKRLDSIRDMHIYVCKYIWIYFNSFFINKKQKDLSLRTRSTMCFNINSY